MADSNAAKQIQFHVTRFNPETDAKPYIQTYAVPVSDGMTVLDGLHWIKENLDTTLVWRYSCRMGICGSCGMLINGSPDPGLQHPDPAPFKVGHHRRPLAKL